MMPFLHLDLSLYWWEHTDVQSWDTLCGCGIRDKHVVATGQGGGPSALSASLAKALDSALHNAPLVGRSLPR